MNSQGSGAKLPESDREDMEVFLAKMQQVLPVLGIESFVQAASRLKVKRKKKCSHAKSKALLPLAT